MKVPENMQTADYWEFRETASQADEVTDALNLLRARLSAGESLPGPVALVLLDAVGEARKEHQKGTNTRVWGPGDTYEVCVGCGDQVMDVYDPDTRASEPGVCRHLKDADYLLRTMFGMGLPTRLNPTGRPG